MYEKVVYILKKYGPMLSGELARKIETEYSVSNAAARKMISRAKSPVQKLFKVTFEKNQKFIYLEEQFNGDKYYKALYQAIKEYSYVNYICIRAFISQNGYISKDMLPALIASPIQNVKKHKKYDRVVSDLLACEIIEDSDEYWELSEWVPCGCVKNLGRAKGLETIKKIIANDFKRWTTSINMSAYNSAEVFNEKAEFAGFRFGYTAPSYVMPIYDEKNQKNGFIIADVFYGEQATKDNISFFIEKVKIIKARMGNIRFMPVIFLESADKETFEILKQNKVIVAVISNFFAESYTNVLRNILEVFTNAAAVISKDPSKIDELFREIEKNEGRFINIAGDLFELMVGHYYQKMGYESITMDKEIVYEGQKNEIDILLKREGKTIVVECKGTKGPIDEEFVEIWLNKNIPNIRKWINQSDSYNSRMLEYELWSMGGFTDEAKKILTEAQAKIRKYTIKYYDGKTIKTRFRDIGACNLVKMINQYYK